jgi:cellulose synthase/poly-beta-1,6-N-acetylglucosamine synthase-like glycosyltransferase
MNDSSSCDSANTRIRGRQALAVTPLEATRPHDLGQSNMKRPAKTPLVSIIVPNYNHALYLEERLNSIISQTFQDFELIILDDNSNDESVAVILHCLKDHNYQLLVNECNSGSTFFFNGTEASK